MSFFAYQVSESQLCDYRMYFKCHLSSSNVASFWLFHILEGPVTNAKNIKADSHKILRPTHFTCTKNIKADSFLALINIKADMKKWIIRPKIGKNLTNIKAENIS